MKHFALLALFPLAACTPETPAPSGFAAADAAPAARFFDRLSDLCGRAFAGRLVSSDEADIEMAGEPMVMHVRTCSEDEIRIPFHIGTDRSRTWVISRTATGLRLKHDHRHEDGSEDAVSQYGGDTVSAGSAQRQEFPADDFSKALFEREGLAVSTANVWAMEVDPGSAFAYELRRTERFFRVEFDLATPVATPDDPW